MGHLLASGWLFPNVYQPFSQYWRGEMMEGNVQVRSTKEEKADDGSL
jgi:hypothetical protein